MLFANVRIKPTSMSACGLVLSGTLVGPCLLPARLIAQRYRDFLDTVLPGLLEDVPLGVRLRL
jgi:hypothetical protein